MDRTERPRSPSALPVVVVGAGPTGLVAAIHLGCAGVPTILVERNTTTSDAAKAISLDDETLRSLQRSGVDALVYPIILPGTGTRYVDATGRTLFYARGPASPPFGHPVKSPFQQPELERVLVGALSRFPSVVVNFDTELLDIKAADDHADVTLRRPDGSVEVIVASYVLGCDGGRSTVRTLLGIDLVGRSFDEPWVVVDTANDPHDERYGIHVADPSRPTVIIPGRDGHCRYEFLLRPGEGTAGGPMDFGLLAKLMAPYRPLRPEDIERQTIYCFHAVVASQWQRDRVFLLGDAAHMMPPFAGQGMNSGVRDADNLAWKIIAVLRGEAGPALLRTYEGERRPHVQLMVDLSVRLGRIVMTTSRPRAALRNATVRTALRLRRGRRFLEEMRYRPRPRITVGLVAPGRLGHPAVGTMLPQPLVISRTGAARLLDSELGAGFALIAVDAEVELFDRLDDLLWKELNAVRLILVTDDRVPRSADDIRTVADTTGQLSRFFDGAKGHFVLVRPDRYVAAVFGPDEEAEVTAVLRSRLW